MCELSKVNGGHTISTTDNSDSPLKSSRNPPLTSMIKCALNSSDRIIRTKISVSRLSELSVACCITHAVMTTTTAHDGQTLLHSM